MAKIVNPVLFSDPDLFNIDLDKFESLGVFNPTLKIKGDKSIYCSKRTLHS